MAYRGNPKNDPRKTVKVILQRQRLVAMAQAKGMTAREIVFALEENGIINPDTGKPYGLGTVGRDLKALKERFLVQTQDAVTAHRAGKLQELNELKRAAWKKDQYSVILNIIARECALLGLDAPTVIKNLNAEISPEDFTDEELAAIAAEGRRDAAEAPADTGAVP